MANRYEELFARLKEEKKKGFIPYTMLGYPNADLSFKAMETMISSGAAALELGLAFSDPLADGPVIQQASAETIESGFKTKDAFALISKVRKLDSKIPITLMCYYNNALAPGAAKFCKLASEAGVDGLLVVDLPPEQSHDFSNHCKTNELQQIFIISPLTTAERLERISVQAGGFLYAVSRLGTTGVEERYDDHLADLIQRASKAVKLPVAVGFGVSNPEQAKRMFELGAEAAITGSRIIEFITDIHKGKSDLAAFSSYIESMVLAGEIAKIGR